MSRKAIMEISEYNLDRYEKYKIQYESYRRYRTMMELRVPKNDDYICRYTRDIKKFKAIMRKCEVEFEHCIFLMNELDAKKMALVQENVRQMR